MDFKIIRGDFHLHTSQRGINSVTWEDYRVLAQRNQMEVLGVLEKHHSITPEGFRHFIDTANAFEVPAVSGVELSFFEGHVSILNVCEGRFESLADCRKALYNPKEIRIIHHPNHKQDGFSMNLLPDITGIEVISGGDNIAMASPLNERNGLTLYQKYLLLRQHVAALAQSGCYNALHFGHVWTQLYIPADAAVTREAAMASLRAGHSIACAGDAEAHFFGIGALAGDTLPKGSDIRWDCPHGAQVSLYVGDQLFREKLPIRAKLTPRRNGPHWLVIQTGAQIAVTSPIWVTGVRKDGEDLNEKRAALLKNVDERRVIRLLETVTAMGNAHPQLQVVVAQYTQWLTPFLAQYLCDDELAVWDMEALQQTHMRRMRLIEDVLTTLMQELTHRHTGVPSQSLLLMKADDEDWDRVVQFPMELPPQVTQIEFKVQGVVLANTVAITKRSPLLAETWEPTQMAQVIIWLLAGEMHDGYIEDVVLTSDGDVMHICFTVAPWYLRQNNGAIVHQAFLLQKAVKSSTYKQYTITVHRYQQAVITLDTTGLTGATPLLEIQFEKSESMARKHDIAIFHAPWRKRLSHPVWATWRAKQKQTRQEGDK